MTILWVLPLPDPQLNDSDDGAKPHSLFSPMMCLSAAQGEKLRLGGRLLVGAFAPSAGVSIHVPPLTPPVRFPVTTLLVFDPTSYSFLKVEVCVIG
jgi:hypothetical protein